MRRSRLYISGHDPDGIALTGVKSFIFCAPDAAAKRLMQSCDLGHAAGREAADKIADVMLNVPQYSAHKSAPVFHGVSTPAAIKYFGQGVSPQHKGQI